MGVVLKKRGVELPPIQRAVNWAFHIEGYSPREIANKTPHAKETIVRFIKRHTESGSTVEGQIPSNHTTREGALKARGVTRYERTN